MLDIVFSQFIECGYRFFHLPALIGIDAQWYGGANSIPDCFNSFNIGFTILMNDDFSTARVMANMFELLPVINSIKDKIIPATALSASTFDTLQNQFRIYIEDVLGLQGIATADTEKLQGVMQLLIDIRKEAKNKKDFVTSDKIRNQLARLGITLKDEKGGDMSWTVETT